MGKQVIVDAASKVSVELKRINYNLRNDGLV